MKRSKRITAPLLMALSIVGITLFQCYWLWQSYVREKKTMKIKAESAFRETMMQLQVARFKLDGLRWDGRDSNINIKMVLNMDEQSEPDPTFRPRPEMITSINIIRNKLKDSLVNQSGPGKKVSLSFNNTISGSAKDSIFLTHRDSSRPTRQTNIIQLLSGVDSMQDSIRMKEIDSAYALTLKKEKLRIPFYITRSDTVSGLVAAPKSNEVLVGFTNPVSYRLELGNTVPYLLRQILQPILFSILLLGITIIAFGVMYKNLLRQQRLAEEKNEFISNITHELQTPIATVGVAIEALRNFNAIDDAERTREYLDISRNELHRLELLVDKVLKLSVFENKAVELQIGMIDLRAITDEVLASLKLQLEKHQATVTVTHSGDIIVPGDRMHLLSVIFNLADNALKYNQQPPVIQIVIAGSEAGVKFSITDNGIGIPAVYQDKVFEKFFRVPHGDTHNAKGYGLGLSYVAQVVQKHRGTISVESQPGKGTTFTILLPRGSSDAAGQPTTTTT